MSASEHNESDGRGGRGGLPKLLRRFVRCYRPYKGLFFLDLGCAAAVACLSLLFPFTVSGIVDSLLPQGEWTLILMACLGLVGVYALNSLLSFVVGYWGERLGLNIETDLRLEAYSHLQKLSFRYFDNNRTGKLASRISNDLLDVGNMVHYGPEHLIIAVSTILGATVLMMRVNVALALVMVALTVAVLTINIYFMRRLVAARKQLFNAIGGLMARLEDGIGGIRVVQAFANEDYQQHLFAQDNRRFGEAKISGFRDFALSESVTSLLTNLLPIAALLGGSWLALNGTMSNGDLFGFILLANAVLVPIRLLAAFSVRFPNGLAGFRNFCELMDREPEIQDGPTASDIRIERGEVRFEQVSFSYDSQKPVLQGISLTAAPGQTVAFVGSSGCGKTTLCSLLPRFYEPSSGRISIDGVDIREMTLTSLRRQIGIVQQDVFLFAGSIRDNIRFGRLDASDEEIWEAARLAQLDEFIVQQADGLDTAIGERGVKLSGGQRQRLAIARMFLKNPPILILDEATSSLDTQTEAAIQQSLARLSEGRTTLVVAHRLPTVRNADRIFVLSEGRVAEQGEHGSLVALGGIYRRLHALQAG
ncbi:MAG: ABC transporter ATP-binding protein/permease [Coriobacteriales bacterium]|nr:ABC transporter ATP-binding protein/permease [Coriobacteriales bacterium]